MRYIARIDSNRTHCYAVRLQREGVHKTFTDRLYGGKRKALQAAKAYRDELIVALDNEGRMTYRRNDIKMRESNNSGVTGVRHQYRERDYGADEAYIASWCDTERQKHKSFSVKKYGSYGAFQKALGVREEAERQRKQGVKVINL